MVQRAQPRTVSVDGIAPQLISRRRLSGVQVEGHRPAAAERRAGGSRDGLSRRAHVRRTGCVLGRLVGPERADTRIAADLWRAARGSRRDVPRNVVADRRGRYDRWQLARHDARAAGAVPSLKIATVRDWSESESTKDEVESTKDEVRSTTEADVVVLRKLRLRRNADRPSGTAFGLLVHEIVARAPLARRARSSTISRQSMHACSG